MAEKNLAECGCVNPKTCEDCKGTGYVRPGKVLPSDIAIAANASQDSDDFSRIPGPSCNFSSSRKGFVCPNPRT